MTVITLTAGTAFIMWLGEQITERGIGNGISLIIFAGIVARLPTAIGEQLSAALHRGDGHFAAIILVLMVGRGGPSSFSSSRGSGGSRFSTPNGWWGGGCTAGRAPICR
jgi:hypothetical protein